MPEALPVVVVMLGYNSGPGLEQAVHAVLRERPRELVVIDNASTDGCADFVLGLQHAGGLTRVRLQHFVTNVGFAAGCNVGVAMSSSPYVLLLNDDAIVRPGYLQVLCNALESTPEAASAIGKVVYLEHGQQRIDSAGLELHRYALRPQDRGQDELDVGQYDTPARIFGPTGAAALYRRSAWIAADGLNEALFAYYEDVDLAWRLLRAGWCHLYEPSAVVEHRRRGPASRPGAMERRAYLNRYRVWAANEPIAAFARYAPLALAWESARLARAAWRRPSFVAAVCRGIPEAIRDGLALRGATVRGPQV